MARNKKQTSGGKRGQGTSSHKNRQTRSHGEHGIAALPPHREQQRLSLLDVARQTERHRDDRQQTDQRKPALSFVHGGMLGDLVHESIVRTFMDRGCTPSTKQEQQEPTSSGPRSPLPSPPRISHSQQHSSAIPDDENYSDDMIVFKGRIAAKTGRKRKQKEALEPTGTLLRDGNDRQSSHANVHKLDQGPVAACPTLFVPSDEAAIDDYIANIGMDSLGDGSYSTSMNHIESRSPSPLERDCHVEPLPAGPLERAPRDHDNFHWSGSRHHSRTSSIALDAKSSSSVDTLEQATRDLQFAMDESEDTTHTSKMVTEPDANVLGGLVYRPKNEVGTAGFANAVKESGSWNEDNQERVAPETYTIGGEWGWDIRCSIDRPPVPLTKLCTLSEDNKEDCSELKERKINMSNMHSEALGEKFQHELHLSGSDLEHQIYASWQADKEKKKHRKREREKARALGLLGRKSAFNSGEQGIDLSEICDRIKEFLEAEDECLSLPPMDKRSRRLVHEFANTFNLKSKSTGNGEKRYPTLYRSRRTLPLTIAQFQKAEERLFRRFGGSNMRPGQSGAVNTWKRTKSSFAAVSYRDGDVVGAEAPEIGSENRGRAMLEKMGWSSGTALGAENNKGILLPVAQTVKNSKHGLG